jgi:hypothetical protein
MMQTWWTYYKDPRTGAVVRVEVRADNPGAAQSLLEAQYGRENLTGLPSPA